MSKTITAYKAFNSDWTCNGFQYEVGKTYETSDPVRICESGFHACTLPADCWRYYDITTSKIARVTVTDPQGHDKGAVIEDTKVVTAKITVEAELTMPEWIVATVDAIVAMCGKVGKLAASGYGSTLAASGYGSTLAASGEYSTLAASGEYSTLAASAYGSTLAASAYGSKLAASGYGSKLAASGNYSTLAASGNDSKLAASGYNSTLAASGEGSKAKVGRSGAICLAYHDGMRDRFVTGYEGEDGIKADTWYEVRDGKLAECK